MNCPQHPTRPLVLEHTSRKWFCIVCRYAADPDTETARREKVRLSKEKDIERGKRSYHSRRAAGTYVDSRKRRAEKAVK